MGKNRNKDVQDSRWNRIVVSLCAITDTLDRVVANMEAGKIIDKKTSDKLRLKLWDIGRSVEGCTIEDEAQK